MGGNPAGQNNPAFIREREGRGEKKEEKQNLNDRTVNGERDN